ncbi:hypothetical protein BDN70DRAFT_928053 [Pholiota conissans]|uniref:Uncharacterized protein n=1 Tax=Pholiota conissans TaxID=109636 RepID=A0A9P6CY38_9AGAR|nr:hypothetical protein BDN70DRAFT_928053 [Pholiota conissans]
MPSQTETEIQPDQRNRTAYRPSIFLLCALIFWTGISAIAEIIIPFDLVLFSLITYAPTLHFAAQSITRSLQRIRPPDTLKASRRARLLVVSWVLNVVVHVGLWLTYRHELWGDMFLLPTIPASQCVLFMVFVIVRYMLDVRMTDREKGLVCRDAEERVPAEIAVAPQSPEATIVNDEEISPQPEEEAQTTTTPIVRLYRPSLFLLLISISLSICTCILEVRDYSYHSTLVDFLRVQAYIPTIILHTYLIVRNLQKHEETLTHATKIAGLSFDLIPLWVGTRLLVTYIHQSLVELNVPLLHLLPGNLEVLLIVHFAIRYTRSIYIERRRQVRLGILTDDNLGTPTVQNESPSVEPTDLIIESSFYQPSTIILLISIVLSGACAYTELLAEYICGIPMAIIVYLPTIFIHSYFIWQQYRTLTASLQIFTRSMEWSLQLAIIWIVTQAFYLFIWPVSPHYNPVVMNPWVRWPQVVLVLYIAARYVWNLYVRSSVGIRLPPDAEPEERSSPVIDPATIHP